MIKHEHGDWDMEACRDMLLHHRSLQTSSTCITDGGEEKHFLCTHTFPYRTGMTVNPREKEDDGEERRRKRSKARTRRSRRRKRWRMTQCALSVTHHTGWQIPPWDPIKGCKNQNKHSCHRKTGFYHISAPWQLSISTKRRWRRRREEVEV